jgi:hypothetical protein
MARNEALRGGQYGWMSKFIRVSDAEKGVAMGSEKKPRPVSPATQLRRRKAVNNLLAGKSVKDSLMEAGYSESTATNNPGEILKGLQREFAGALNKLLPIEGMCLTLIEGLAATKTAHVYNPKLGIVEHFKEPDHFSRVKCAELLAKLGGFITRKEESRVTHGVDYATVIAARRRAGLLPAATVDVQAEPVGDTPQDMPAET